MIIDYVLRVVRYFYVSSSTETVGILFPIIEFEDRFPAGSGSRLSNSHYRPLPLPILAVRYVFFSRVLMARESRSFYTESRAEPLYRAGLALECCELHLPSGANDSI